MNASVRTVHEAPEEIAAALRADHTTDITTEVDDGELCTTITREQPGSLRATLDDYLVNLIVATQTREETETMTTPDDQHSNQ